MEQFAQERIEGKFVLFEIELHRYHTVNLVAFDIRRSYDEVRSVDLIADSM